jgi:hypothetical protein
MPQPKTLWPQKSTKEHKEKVAEPFQLGSSQDSAAGRRGHFDHKQSISGFSGRTSPRICPAEFAGYGRAVCGIFLAAAIYRNLAQFTSVVSASSFILNIST